MRIALVSEHASPLAVLGGADAGGQNVYVAALAEELGRRGHEVVVHTRRDATELPDRVRFAPNVVVEHVEAGPAKVLDKDHLWPLMDSFANRLRTSWRRRPPDVVHAHFWMSGIASLDAAMPLGIPVLQTFHALGAVKRRHQRGADTSPPDRLRAELRIVTEADRIVATCSDEAFELRQLGADMARVSIVPCGVDAGQFSRSGPRAPSGELRHRIVTISRLVPRKGIDDAIRALPAIPDTELVIAGGPPPEDLDGDREVRRLRDIAVALGVADRVRLVGAVPRGSVPPLLRSADVLVATAWYEPFGIVPLEAMASGVPVVASAVGGMIDTVADGVTGVLVPPRDPQALATAVRGLLGDPSRREDLGRAGVERVRARYTWSRVADGVLGAYRRAMDRRTERRVVSL